MRSLCWLYVCSAILLCSLDQNFAYRLPRASSSQNNSVASILEFLNSQDGRWLGTERNVVLVLGNTGVGKSTLVTLLTNSTGLVSKGSAGEFLLDDSNRISSDCTIKSKTHVPELVIEPINGVPYYDCPGFGDTRGLQYELVQTYFIRRILDYSESVKFVFVIDSASMKKGGDRKNFPRLAKYATSIIKDIQKYNESIAMIITKVENTYEVQEDGISVKLVDDDTKKQAIVGFLAEMKKDLQADEEFEDREAIIKFIDMISLTKSGKYERIGLFRVPNIAGPVSKIPLMVATTRKLIEIVGNISYTRTDMNDFGFTLSAESMITVHDKYDELFNDLKANIQKVNADIIKFYVEKEKKLKDIFELKQILQYAHGNMSQIVPSVSRKFHDAIVYTLHDLGVSVSGESLNNILKTIEYVNILKQVSNHKALSTPELNLNGAIGYLSNSFKWYSFLTDLHETLSTYDVQNNIPNLKTSIKKLRLDTSTSEVRVADIGLKSFLDAINNKKYSEVAGMWIAASGVKALKEVLDQMTDNVVSKSCESQVFTYTGKFVKTSDVVKDDCWKDATNIRVFASNSLFIDADLDKSDRQVQIAFIAPTWRVFGQRTINLNGKHAKHPTEVAKNGSRDGKKDGSHGKVGLNGSPAGNFFGIGERFFDSESLKIDANGGNGGNGQQGGNGVAGVMPDAPPLTPADQATKLWDNMNLKYTKTKEYKEVHYITSYEFKVYDVVIDKNNDPPGIGGNGGAGGFGGHGGDVYIVAFGKMPNFSISKNQGSNGANGAGGRGGSGVAAEKIYSIEIKSKQSSNFGAYSPSVSYESKILSERASKTQPNGANGGLSDESPTPAVVVNVTNRAELIIEFKEKTLRYLVDSIAESELRQLFKSLDNDERIQSLFDSLSFIREFLSIESHFIELRSKISFIPFLESLLQRIVAFEESHKPTTESKKIFNYLYSAVYGKITTIKSHANRDVVVDLPKYLGELRDNIQDLDKIDHKVAINNRRDEYKMALDKKIESATNVIENEVLPAIEKVYNQIDEDIDGIFSENVLKQNATKNTIKSKHQSLLEMQSKLAVRKIMIPFRIFGTLLPMAGPYGATAGSAVNGINGLVDKLYLDKKNADGAWHSAISATLSSTVDIIDKRLKKNAELTEKQLKKMKADAEKELAKDPVNHHLLDIVEKVDEIQARRAKNKDVENGVHDGKFREELAEFFEKKKEDIRKEREKEATQPPKSPEEIKKEAEEEKKREKDKEAADEKKKKEDELQTKVNKTATEFLIENGQHIIDCYDLTVEQFDKIAKDEEAIETVANAIKASEQELETLKKQQQLITSQMITAMNRIKNNITDWTDDDKSIVEKNLKNWKIQQSIRETKALFDKLTDSYSAKSDLQLCFSKIEEGMAFLAEVYDRIDTYSESKQLADYIADISFGERVSDDATVNAAITELERMIASNIILERYEVAVSAFQQHYFPFAYVFLGRFTLPSSLKMNQSEAIKKEAIKQLNHLQSASRLSEASIGQWDHYVTKDKDTVFYTWWNNSIKTDVAKLLRGEEIVLSADIADGLNFDGVKFKNIGIKFVHDIPCRQGSLDRTLKHFAVNMTMIGESYYRCGSRFYSMSTNENVAIRYSFANFTDGFPHKFNTVYEKIQQNEFFLSPYTMWSIKLEGQTAGFDLMDKFANDDIHLRLVGAAQYLENFPVDYCNEHVDDFYRLDRTVTVN